MPGAFHGVRVALVLVLMLVPTLSRPGACPHARARPHSLSPCSPWCLPWCSSSLSLALLTLVLALVLVLTLSRPAHLGARPGARPSARPGARPGACPGARPSARPGARPGAHHCGTSPLNSLVTSAISLPSSWSHQLMF
jgi:hypothetical protein